MSDEKQWVLTAPEGPCGWVEVLTGEAADLVSEVANPGDPVTAPPWLATLARWAARLLEEIPADWPARSGVRDKLATCLRRALEDGEFQKQVRTVVALGDGEAGLRWMLREVYGNGADGE